MTKNNKYDARKFGQATEFRVASELLLQGYNPFMASLDMGVDIILENGVRIQVKGSHLFERLDRPGQLRASFKLQKYGNSGKVLNRLENVDYLIGWIPETNDFYIIPAEVARGTLTMSVNPKGNDKWTLYKNA